LIENNEKEKAKSKMKKLTLAGALLFGKAKKGAFLKVTQYACCPP
jgi:predicted HTH transcriptional regulator